MKDYKKILYTLLYESPPGTAPAGIARPEKMAAAWAKKQLSRILLPRLPSRETSTAPPPEWGPDNPNVVGADGKTYAEMMAAKRLENRAKYAEEDRAFSEKKVKDAADKVELNRRQEEVRNSTTKSGGVTRGLTRGEANAQVPGAYPSPTTYAEQDVQDLQIKMSVVNAARGTNNPSESRAAWQVAQAVETERNRMNSSWRPSPGMPAEWNRQDRLEDFDKYRSGKTTAESNAAREADRVAERVRTTGTKRPDRFITTSAMGELVTTVNPDYDKQVYRDGPSNLAPAKDYVTPETRNPGDWAGQSQADADLHKTQAWKNLHASQNTPESIERQRQAVHKRAERSAFLASTEGKEAIRQNEIRKLEAQKVYDDARGDDKSHAAHRKANDARRLHLLQNPDPTKK